MSLLTVLIATVLFIFIIGLCFGSFLNVVILRAFSNESIVLPPSKCPSCNTPLKWYHNIPVLSYLFLRGKCGFCKKPISIQYPVIELITGLLFVAVVYKFNIGLNAVFMLAVTCLFIVLAVTDIKEKVVFDYHTYLLVFIGLVYNFFNVGHLYSGNKLISLGQISFSINNSFIAAVLGLLLGVVIMEILARFGYLVAGTRAFGEGDSYIAAGLGALFGWKYLLTVLIYSFVIQIILTIPVFVKKLFAAGDYKTLISFLAFFLLIILIKITDYIKWAGFMTFGVLTLLLICVGFYLCKRILGGLKEPSNMTYLPFGPAMVLGAFILMFMM